MNFLPLLFIAGGIIFGRQKKTYYIYDADKVESPLIVEPRHEFSIRLKNYGGEWSDESNLRTLHSIAQTRYAISPEYTIFTYTSKMEGDNDMKYINERADGGAIYSEFVISTKKK